MAAMQEDLKAPVGQVLCRVRVVTGIFECMEQHAAAQGADAVLEGRVFSHETRADFPQVLDRNRPQPGRVFASQSRNVTSAPAMAGAVSQSVSSRSNVTSLIICSSFTFGSGVGAVINSSQMLEIQVRVYLRGLDIRMTQQFLHGAQVL